MDQQLLKRDEMEECFGSGKFWHNGACNDKPSSESFQKVNNPQIEKCFQDGQVWEGGTCHDRSIIERQYEQRKTQEYADYCRQNPDKCKPGQTGVFNNSEDKNGFENFCTKNPERCKNVAVDQTGQKRECESDRSKQYGCRLTGDRCDCPGSNSGDSSVGTRCGGGTYWNGSACVYSSGTNNVTSPQQQQQQKTPEQMCAEASNCHWENGNCNCSSGSSGSTSQSPEQQCNQSGKCWKDGSCQDCSASSGGGGGGGDCESHGGHWENGNCIGAVQGVTTKVGIIQKIINFIKLFF